MATSRPWRSNSCVVELTAGIAGGKSTVSATRREVERIAVALRAGR